MRKIGLLLIGAALTLAVFVAPALAAPHVGNPGGNCNGFDGPNKIDTSDGAIVLPAGTVVCVKAGNGNTGTVTLTVDTTLADIILASGLTNGGGQVPNVSNYVTYPQEVTSSTTTTTIPTTTATTTSTVPTTTTTTTSVTEPPETTTTNTVPTSTTTIPTETESPSTSTEPPVVTTTTTTTTTTSPSASLTTQSTPPIATVTSEAPPTQDPQPTTRDSKSGSESATKTANAQPKQALAFTGIEDVVPIGAAALVLLTTGSGLLWLSRRKDA